MRKLEKLKIERSIASMLTALPKQTLMMIDKFYDNAIYGIEHYGLDNEAVSPESLRSIQNTLSKISD